MWSTRVLTVFTVLCATGWSAAARAQIGVADPFAGDPRLSKKCTIRAIGEPLAELLADLSAKVGVRLEADRTAAGDKATLFAHDRPLAESMRAIARFFRFNWRRSGKEGEYVYSLYQDAASRKEEERELLADLFRVVDRILADMEACRRLSSLTPEQLAAKEEELKPTLPGDEQRLAQWIIVSQMRLSPVVSTLARILEGMNRDRLAQWMLSGEPMEWSWPASHGASVLPIDDGERIAAHIKADVSAHADMRDQAFNQVTITLKPSGRANPSIQVLVLAGNRSNAGLFTYGHVLPVSPRPRASPEVPTAPPDWQKDPELIKTVSVDWRTVSNTRPEDRLDLWPAPPGEALAALEKGHPIDLITDAFWSSPRKPMSLRNVPLGEALTTIALEHEHYWRKAEGFTEMRRHQYALYRRAEPPTDAMRRWAALARRDAFQVDDMAEVAGLPDAQIYVAAEVLRQVGGSGSTAFLIARGHLALWNALRPAQRREALTRGVRFASLNPAQQRLFVLASTGRLKLEDVTSSDVAVAWTPELLQSSVFHLRLRSSRSWRLLSGPGRGTVQGPKSREEAIKFFQTKVPHLNPEHVVEVTQVAGEFQYGPPGQPLVRGSLIFPERRAETKARPQ